jgi:hypothetical protein
LLNLLVVGSMVDIDKLKQDMQNEEKAELAVEKLEQNLQQSSSEKGVVCGKGQKYTFWVNSFI